MKNTNWLIMVYGNMIMASLATSSVFATAFILLMAVSLGMYLVTNF